MKTQLCLIFNADSAQAEAKRTRGTPLTPATFDKWRKSFLSDLNVKRDKEENERIKALPPKEREEYRRRRERLSGAPFTLQP